MIGETLKCIKYDRLDLEMLTFAGIAVTLLAQRLAENI